MKITVFIVASIMQLLFACSDITKHDKANENMANNEFVQKIGYYNFTELGLACYRGDLEKFKKLVEKGACKDCCVSDNEKEYDALYASILFGRAEIIEYLINNGESVNKVCDEKGTSLLSIACCNKNKELAFTIAKLLIDLGADINGNGNFIGDNVDILLHNAILNNNIKLTEYLIEKGADIRMQNTEGESIFTIAAEHCDSSMQEFIWEFKNDES